MGYIKFPKLLVKEIYSTQEIPLENTDIDLKSIRIYILDDKGHLSAEIKGFHIGIENSKPFIHILDPLFIGRQALIRYDRFVDGKVIQ